MTPEQPPQEMNITENVPSGKHQVKVCMAAGCISCQLPLRFGSCRAL